MLSADALAPVLEEQYGCDVSRCRLIKALILHTYHAVAGEEQYIFRIYPCARRTETAIMAELKLLDYLDAAGVPVSVLVPAKKGRLLLSFSPMRRGFRLTKHLVWTLSGPTVVRWPPSTS